MKKILFILVMMLFASFVAQAQNTVTGHCYTKLIISDDNYSYGDYYDVALRMETTDPWASGWVFVARYYYPTTYSINNVIVSEVPYDPPVDPGYYIIRVKVVKNLTPPGRDGYATASPTEIDESNVRFDADYDIQVSL